MNPVLKKLSHYHQYKVVGINYIPDKGPAIIALNHSLATYDIALLGYSIYEKKRRVVRALADRWFFKLPYVSTLVKECGAIEGNHINAQELLKQEEIITVAPGGMKEALRPSSERYQLQWADRRGFAKLAIDAGVPIILAVCPKADDLYDVYKSKVTEWAYKNFKVPIFFASGLAGSPLPRPIKLTHFLSPPIYPPKKSENSNSYQRQITMFHKKIIKNAEELIGQAIAYR